MIRDHAFRPSAADPTRCGVRMPTTARYPAPATQECGGPAKDHPALDEFAGGAA